MKLITKEEINRVKRIINYLIQPTRNIHLVVIILFFFIWSNIVTYIDPIFQTLLIIPIGLILPIMLLIGALQYRSHRVYSIVLSICFFSIFLDLASLVNWLDIYLNSTKFELASLSICPICEIETDLRFICISLIAIALLHNKRIVELYNWKIKSFIQSILGACLFYLLIQLLNIAGLY